MVVADLIFYDEDPDDSSVPVWTGNHVPNHYIRAPGAENPNDCKAGSNELHIDGHVEWIGASRLTEYLESWPVSVYY